MLFQIPPVLFLNEISGWILLQIEKTHELMDSCSFLLSSSKEHLHPAVPSNCSNFRVQSVLANEAKLTFVTKLYLNSSEERRGKSARRGMR